MRALCALVCLVAAVGAMEFDCRTMVPYSRLESEAEPGDDKPYRVTVIGNTYRPGQEVEVHIDGSLPIYKLVLQARSPADDVPLGTWEVTSESQKTHQCEAEGDSVTSASLRSVEGIRVIWLAPPQGVGNVEMVATIMDTNNRFWMEVNSIMLRQDTTARLPSLGSSPPPTGDDHGRQREDEIKIQMDKRFQKEVDDENLSSEGDWTKEQEKERKEHEEEMHKETMEYERMAQQEEREREARIRAEILDKELYDKQQEERREREELERERAEVDREQKEVEISRDGIVKDSGSAAVSASLIGSFLVLCITFLL